MGFQMVRYWINSSPSMIATRIAMATSIPKRMSNSLYFFMFDYFFLMPTAMRYWHIGGKPVCTTSSFAPNMMT